MMPIQTYYLQRLRQQMDRLVHCSVCRDVQDTIGKMRQHLNEKHKISDDAVRAWVDYLDMRVLFLEGTEEY